MSQPEAWLRGPVPGYAPELQPVVHALLQAREDLERIASLPADRLAARAGGSATIGYHLRHAAGSLDRLLTYARGEGLSATQLEQLRDEAAPVTSPRVAVDAVRAAIDDALTQLRATPAESLDQVREVGRARLPATVRGLLFHAAEHTTRHVGQMLTLVRVLDG